MAELATAELARGGAGGVLEADAAVVGGGPAGLAAAGELARGGLRVVLVEESAELGGQYYKCRAPALAAVAGEFRPQGSAMIAAVHDAGVRVLCRTSVWGVDDDGSTLLAVDGAAPQAGDAGARLLRISARAILVAAGAYERPRPFPGWQLPGVTTAGHALHLAACDGVPIGRRVVVAGTGPFLLAAAAAVLRAGGGVVAVLERSRPYLPSFPAFGSLAAPSRLVELAGYLATLARHGTRLAQGSWVVSAAGDGRVEEVTVERASGASRRLAVDALAVGFGFRPSSELLQLLGARGRFGPLGDFVPEVSGDGRVLLGRSGVAKVYCAGEVAGVAGARAAVARGVLAGAAALADFGGRVPPSAVLRRARRQLSSELKFAALIERLYPVGPQDFADVADEALVCRCEGVTAGEVRAALGRVGADAGSVKGLTRVGMGPCQGRLCAATLCAIVAAAGGSPVRPLTGRMPLRPLPIAALLDGAEGSGALLDGAEGVAR